MASLIKRSLIKSVFVFRPNQPNNLPSSVMKVHHDQGAEAQHCEDYAKTVTTNHPPTHPVLQALLRSGNLHRFLIFVLFISAVSGARLVTFWHTEWPTPESSEEGVYIFFPFRFGPTLRLHFLLPTSSSWLKHLLCSLFSFLFFPSSEVRSHPRGKFTTNRSGDPCLFLFFFPIIFLHLFFFLYYFCT